MKQKKKVIHQPSVRTTIITTEVENPPKASETHEQEDDEDWRNHVLKFQKEAKEPGTVDPKYEDDGYIAIDPREERKKLKEKQKESKKWFCKTNISTI